jgi:2-amino-4-hydroxy-6-hydroxymethyldihydropteridine diphosphokinase
VARSRATAGLNRVAIALGSNLGDREAHLAAAVAALGRFITNLRVSRWHQTAPVGVGPQPEFLNGAAAGDTAWLPREVLDELLAIERACGRTRPYEGAARTLDLDIILFGDEVIDEPGLRVPHPRFRHRQFVLEPLAEVAADWRDPETGETIAQLLAALKSRPPG